MLVRAPHYSEAESYSFTLRCTRHSASENPSTPALRDLRPVDLLTLNPVITLEALGPRERVGLRELELISLDLIAELSHVKGNLGRVGSLTSSHSNLFCLLP